MTKFTSALVFVLASAISMSEARIPISDSLKDTVKSETMRIPTLRQKDAERKNVLQDRLASMAVDPNEQKKRQMEDANYNADYSSADYSWDQYMDQNGIGFDITNYAIKYTQCATVQTYSDALAADGYTNTVLAAKRFALFRLCPKDQCSSYSNNGCGSNYGEYLVSLDQFLLSMMEYQEQRVAGYCEYCQNCAAIESAKHFWQDVEYTRNYALTNAQASYSTWYTNYLESYAANYDSSNSYQNVDANTAAQNYYEQIRNSNNYANTYANNNYGSNSQTSSSSSSSSSGSSSNNYQNANNYQNTNNYQNSNNYNSNSNYGSSSGSNTRNQYQWANQDMWTSSNTQNQYSNQESWSSMGSRGGSFYGKSIMNGYYSGDGVFIQIYGYFNSQGTYVSLEDDEIEWDEGLWGEEPATWADVDINAESCSYKYAGSCYNQYESCMQILDDQDYQQYQQYQAANENQYSQYQYQQAQDNTQRKATLKDFLGCVEVDPSASGNGNDYSTNANYQNQYQNYQNNQGNSYQYAQQNSYNEQMSQYNQEQNANRRYFVGPHCGSNGRDISLAVYSDEYCSVVDESTTVEKVLGYSPYSDSIEMFPDECISCLMEETQEAWYEDEEVYTLEPMCSMLYQFAGKCNTNLKSTEYNAENQGYNAYSSANAAAAEDADEDADADADTYYEWKTMYQSENQAENEKAVCSFISSLASNTYNENGEVQVDGGFWTNPSSWNREFAAESRAMSPGIKAALVLTAFAALAMAIMACVLHGSLARKNIPWRPRRSKGQDPTDLARQNSGITMGRSRSGPGGNPLL